MSKTSPSKTTQHTHDHQHDHDHAHDHSHTDNVVQPNSKITVTIPWATVQPAYTKVIQKAAQHLKADGFRIGKVPLHVAEKMLKQDAIVEEVAQQVLPAAYSKALQDSDKKPISRPEIDPVQMEKEKDWVFDVYFAELQPIVLGKYQDTVKKAVKEAQKEIEEKNAELKKTAKETDAKSDDKDKEEKAKKPTELTETQQEDVKLKHIFKNFVETIQPKVQEILIRTEVDRELRQLVDQLKQLNLKVEDYLRSRQVTVEQLQQEYAASALTSLQIEFILAEIARDQKLTVTEEEIDKMLEQIGGGKLSQEQRKDADYRSYIFSNLLKQKVIKYLLTI
jgi:FKBP-type peptidyl-prolyl cis-trans isomerase (trigger factor)